MVKEIIYEINEVKPVESEWPYMPQLEGGNHLSDPVTYDGVKNLINEAVKEINESNIRMIESAKEQFEKTCISTITLSEKGCSAKSFITEDVKKKFYENIRSTEKAHERIDSHLISHKNISGLIRWLITILASSGWIFALLKYLIAGLQKVNS